MSEEFKLNTEEFNEAQGETPESEAEQQPPQDGGDSNLILGKFKTQEDLAKAYQNLEKKLGSGGTDVPETETGDEPKEPEKDVDSLEITQDESEPEGNESGINFQRYSEILSENNGTLTEEAYEELEGKGIPRDVVNVYINGLQLQQKQQQDFGVNLVGGADNYAAMQSWAASNMAPEDISSFNEAVTSSNRFVVEAAISTLYQKFQNATGKESKLIQGSPSATSGIQPFESFDEQVAAMSDPRYRTDAKYRKEFEQRLALGIPK